ncbi:MAG: polymer-forming cytoskeletal protein [Actinomycetota bacterium]
MPAARSLFALAIGALCLASASVASAQATRTRAEPRDQIVLSGDVLVRRGQEVGEVVVLRGTVTVAGVVRGDVVVLDGRITVTGQVSGAAVSVGGSVALGSSSRILGDVLAHGRVIAAPGARVDGDVREGVTFTLRTPIEALGRFAPWLAVWFSVLALGVLLLLFGPRAADAVALSAREAPRASAGWGVVAFVVLPLAGIAGVLTLVWLPLGLGLLLSLFLLYSIGLTWSAFALGRLIWHEPRSRMLAFTIGWAILAAIAAIPIVGSVVWVAGAVFGLGSGTVAIWRARVAAPRPKSTGGRHRQGGKMPVVIPAASAEPEPMIVEREMGEEGAGL